MSKIICEICGTSYEDTAASCPICGWANSKTGTSAPVSEDFDLDLMPSDAEPAETAPKAPIPVPQKKGKVFDYDAVNGMKVDLKEEKLASAEDDEDDDDDEDEDDEEEEGGTNVFLVVVLVVLIVALLLVSGFIFWKYYLPTRQTDASPAETVTAEVLEPEETESLLVPCTGLSLVDGMGKLNYEGQNWLLHIKAVPEDTTDVISFMSEDESVVTVNEEGRVTAVGEGETRIVITCGEQKIDCPAVVDYTPETQPVVEETENVESETLAEGEVIPEAGTEEQTPAYNPDVVLKLKKNDITFGIRGVYATLELDCDLTADQIQWSTRNSNVATVRNGDVTAVGPGLTVITAKYGNQEVECIVRCNF